MRVPQRLRSSQPEAESAVLAAAGELSADIGEMIRSARQQVAQVVNAGLTLLHWRIGSRIRREVLREERAERKRAMLMGASRFAERLKW